jgi:hypothetical protein
MFPKQQEEAGSPPGSSIEAGSGSSCLSGPAAAPHLSGAKATVLV